MSTAQQFVERWFDLPNHAPGSSAELLSEVKRAAVEELNPNDIEHYNLFADGSIVVHQLELWMLADVSTITPPTVEVFRKQSAARKAGLN